MDTRSEAQGDQPQSATLGVPLFDEPDFFERFVLGNLAEDPRSDAGWDSAEQQRVLRQATQICQFLNQRQRDLDARQAELNRVEAIQADEARNARLQHAEQQAELAARQRRLEQWAQAQEQRARELAAWEHAIQAEVDERMEQLDCRQRDLDQRQMALDRREHVETGSPAPRPSSGWVKSATEALIDEPTDPRNTSEASSLQRLREARTVLNQWQDQLTTWQASRAAWSQFFEQQRDELTTWLESLPESEVAEESETWIERIRVGYEQGQTLARLLDEWRDVWRNALEDRLITTELHAHLCEVCDEADLDSIRQAVRERVDESLVTVDTLLETFREEVRDLSVGLELRLRQFHAQERQLVSGLRERLDRIQSMWLMIDPQQAAQGPHWRGATAEAFARGEDESVSRESRRGREASPTSR